MSSALAALRIPGIGPLEVALPALLNDLAASQTQHVVILDDYHVLKYVRTHDRLPPSRRWNVSICSSSRSVLWRRLWSFQIQKAPLGHHDRHPQAGVDQRADTVTWKGKIVYRHR